MNETDSKELNKETVQAKKSEQTIMKRPKMDPTIRAIGSARTSEIGVDSYASLAADKKNMQSVHQILKQTTILVH